MSTRDDPDSPHHGQAFRASLVASLLILVGAVLVGLWSVLMFSMSGDPLFQAISLIFGPASVLVALIMVYRLLWRPVMVRVDEKGLFLKAYDQTIPWSALEGARLVTRIESNGGKSHVIEFVTRKPLHPELARGKLKLGSRANALAGLPDYCYAMTGIDGTNAMLLAAISLHVPVLPAVVNSGAA